MSYCSECNNEKSRQARKSVTPEERLANSRKVGLKRNFGITPEQYQELSERQNGQCAICLKTAEEEKRALAVDHDHKTGEIFGLLCWWCNHKFVGRRRNPEHYLRAAEFLREGTGWFVPPKRKTIKRKPK